MNITIENKKQKNSRTYLDTLIDKYEKKKFPTCEQKCVLKDLYQDIMKIKEIKSVESTDKSVEYYQIVKIVHENLSGIVTRLSELSDFIKKLPEDYAFRLQETFYSIFQKVKENKKSQGDIDMNMFDTLKMLMIR